MGISGVIPFPSIGLNPENSGEEGRVDTKNRTYLVDLILLLR